VEDDGCTGTCVVGALLDALPDEDDDDAGGCP
jgi:hypothetical protein